MDPHYKTGFKHATNTPSCWYPVPSLEPERELLSDFYLLYTFLLPLPLTHKFPATMTTELRPLQRAHQYAVSRLTFSLDELGSFAYTLFQHYPSHVFPAPMTTELLPLQTADQNATSYTNASCLHDNGLTPSAD